VSDWGWAGAFLRDGFFDVILADEPFDIASPQGRARESPDVFGKLGMDLTQFC
jgi:hypothetical protein